MAIPVFETSRGLHTLDQGVAKMLEVITLCQISLSPESLDFYKDTGEGSKSEDCDFWPHARVTEKRGRETVHRQASGEWHLDVIYLTLNGFKVHLLKDQGYIFRRCIHQEMSDSCLDRFI
jgi:hypothetical protein